MESVTTFDVMYRVEQPVANVWEARMLAQSKLSQDLFTDFSIDAHDAEMDSVQFRVSVHDSEVPHLSRADGVRAVA